MLLSPSRLLSNLSPRQLGWVVFVAIFGGAAGCLGFLYAISIDHKQQELRRHVRDLAEAAAGLVDVAQHERLIRPEQFKSDEYLRVLAPLARYQRRHSSIEYLWTVRVLPGDRQIFVLETAVVPEIRDWQLSLGRKQVVLEFLAPNKSETAIGETSLATLRADQSMVFPVPYEDEHGTYIEARAPLRDAGGRFVGYVGVDYALDSYERQVDEVRLGGVIALVLALLLATGLARGAAGMRRETIANRERLRQAEAEMRTQRDLAQKANEAKGELLRIAAHDLKNPLAAIAGMSGLLAKTIKSRTGQAALAADVPVVETIHDSARHMSDIVRGILMGEGLEQGGLPFAPAPTDLSGLVADIVRFNNPAAHRKGITLRLVVPSGIVASVDAKLLREACDNYISNAVKYSPTGKPVSVTLGRQADGGIEFAVQDEGPGLSETDQAQLFQKFKKLTPRPTGGESSSGLGLSIVKTIAELHGGAVGCDTAPGRGARFWLRILPSPAR